MTALQQTLTFPAPPAACSHHACAEPIERSGMCPYHRAVIDPDYLARFDAAWDGVGREDWLKLVGAIHEAWWADDRRKEAA